VLKGGGRLLVVCLVVGSLSERYISYFVSVRRLDMGVRDL
jgi:hypothetical protein